MTYPSEQVTAQQLQQLSKTIFQTKALLGTWSDKLIDIRALQMDEAIVCVKQNVCISLF